MQTIDIAPEWEKLLKSYVKKTFFKDTRKENFAEREDFTEGDYRFFAKGLADLNIAFTQERAELPKNYLNQKEFRSAYLLYFLPVNALKVSALVENEMPPLSDSKSTFSLLDIGCGPGTGTLGFLHALSRQFEKQKLKLHLKITLIDQNKSILYDARQIITSYLEILIQKNIGWELTYNIETIVGDILNTRLNTLLRPSPDYNLVLMLNVLSELLYGKRRTIIEQIFRHYSQEKTRVLVMEPALRMTSRDLQKLRNDLIEYTDVKILSPCLHEAPCPMLEMSDRDWCHTYIPWKRPYWIEKLDRLVGIKKDYLKCSYLILGREALPNLEKMKPPVWRIVSGALNSKGKSERLLCGPQNTTRLFRLRRLDKETSPANKDFELLERGDIVKISNFDITKGTKLQKVSFNDILKQ